MTTDLHYPLCRLSVIAKITHTRMLLRLTFFFFAFGRSQLIIKIAIPGFLCYGPGTPFVHHFHGANPQPIVSLSIQPGRMTSIDLIGIHQLIWKKNGV